jgi:beta-galactosidase beta subunit
MSPYLDQEPIKTYGLFLEKLLNLTNHELDMMEGRNITNLQDLVHYVPSLERLMMALNLSQDTAEQLMVAPIKNPSELVKMLTSDQPLKMLCSKEFWQNLVSWTNSTSSLSSALCHMNDSDVISTIIDSLRVSNLVKILENGTSTEKPNWKNIIDEVMHMVKSVELLINTTSSHLSLENAFSNVMKAYTSQNSTEDFTALFKVYGELAVMFNNTEVWQKVNEFLQTGDLLMTSAIRFIDRLVTLDPNDFTGILLGLMKPNGAKVGSFLL